MIKSSFLALLLSVIIIGCGEEGTCVIERDTDIVCIENADKADCEDCNSVDGCTCADFSDDCTSKLVADSLDYHQKKTCADAGYPTECKTDLFWSDRYNCNDKEYF